MVTLNSREHIQQSLAGGHSDSYALSSRDRSGPRVSPYYPSQHLTCPSYLVNRSDTLHSSKEPARPRAPSLSASTRRSRWTAWRTTSSTRASRSSSHRLVRRLGPASSRLGSCAAADSCATAGVNQPHSAHAHPPPAARIHVHKPPLKIASTFTSYSTRPPAYFYLSTFLSLHIYSSQLSAPSPSK